MLEKKTALKATAGIVASLSIVAAGAAVAIPSISGASELTDPQNQVVAADSSLKAKTVNTASKSTTTVADAPASAEAQAEPVKAEAPAAEEKAPEAPIESTEPEHTAPVEAASFADAPEQVVEAQPQAVQEAAAPVQENTVPEAGSDRWHLVECQDLGNGEILKIWESDDVSGDGWSLGTAQFAKVVPNDGNPYIGQKLVSFQEQGDEVFAIWEDLEEVSGDGWSIGTSQLMETVPASSFFCAYPD